MLQSTGKPLKRSSSSRRLSQKISFFGDVLIDWFQTNGRKYPWRTESHPYRILMAEIMLQRTRSEQVVSVYNDFISRFPDIDSLVSAHPSDINKFIARLGLFWRTNLVLEMANKISKDFNGLIPNDRSQLCSIPGIGDYIADMLCVLAFHGRRIGIDTNVIRLVTRFFGIKPEGEMRRKRDFIEFCQRLVRDIHPEQVREINLALIDFPSIICKPRPLCQICPLSAQCNYFKKELIIRDSE